MAKVHRCVRLKLYGGANVPAGDTTRRHSNRWMYCFSVDLGIVRDKSYRWYGGLATQIDHRSSLYRQNVNEMNGSAVVSDSILVAPTGL